MSDTIVERIKDNNGEVHTLVYPTCQHCSLPVYTPEGHPTCIRANREQARIAENEYRRQKRYMIIR